MIQNTILVAVDGSEAADRAVNTAGELASRLGDHILIVHVREEEQTVRGSAGSRSVEAAERVLETAVDAMAARGLSAESKVVAGLASVDDVADAIVHQAQLASAEFIVTGKRARSVVDELIVGSVTHKIIRLAPCPVIVVR